MDDAYPRNRTTQWSVGGEFYGRCSLMMAGSGWSTEETRSLISLWGEANVQSQLDSVSWLGVSFG